MPIIVPAQQKIIVVQDPRKVDVIGAVPGPPGPQGNQGPQGPAGPNGPLGGLSDVNTAGVTDKAPLAYDLASGLWKPATEIDVARLRLTSTDDASETSTTHALQIGADGGANMIMDNNELIYRNGNTIEGLFVTGRMRSTDGSASAPGHSFANDTNTGMFRKGTDAIGFATGGAERVSIGSNGYLHAGWINTVSGATTSTPTRIYASQDNYIRYMTPGEFAKTALLNNVVTISRIQTWAGDADHPSHSFHADTNTGFYRYGENVIGIAGGGGRIGRMQVGKIYTENGSYWTSLGADGIWGRLETAQSKFYINKEIHLDTGILSSYNENLTLQDSGVTVAWLGAATGAAALTVYNNHAASTSAANLSGSRAGILIRTRNADPEAQGAIAGLSMWTQHSTDRHVHQRVFWAGGDALGYRNWENTAWVGLQASSFAVQSTNKIKRRIRTAREEGGLLNFAVPGPRKMALDQIRKLRPVLFDDEVQERLVKWDGCDAHEKREECTDAGCENEHNTKKHLHICDDYECGGTNERPCDLVSRHVNRVGLIAEEVEEVFPRAVTQDMFGENKGIDYAAITVEAINVIQHLSDQVEELEERLAALEAA